MLCVGGGRRASGGGSVGYRGPAPAQGDERVGEGVAPPERWMTEGNECAESVATVSLSRS